MRVARNLLGRHVRGRAADQPARIVRVAEPRGDAEVGEVGVVLLVQQHVRGLQVAVHDALAVCVRERAADLGEQARGGLQLPGAAIERLPQRAAAQPAHHQVGAVGIAPVVVERDDVRVLELRDELCLGLEATDEGGLVDELGADDLDRHLAADRGLIGAVDDAEVAGADLLAKLVAADGAAESRAGRPR